MIGSLQRQLDGASRTLNAASFAGTFGMNGHRADARAERAAKTASTKNRSAKAKTAKRASKSGATKVDSTADRTSKRASKSAAAKRNGAKPFRETGKSAGRSRSGASRKAAKTTR
jgi:hypothetical protein